MRGALIILSTIFLFFCACKNHKPVVPEEAKEVLQPEAEDGNSLISDKIHQTIVSINEFEETQDAVKVEIMQRKRKDIEDETRDACEYLDKWKERLIDEAGGMTDVGALKHGDDTLIATRLLVKNASADTLRWHMEEVREVFLRDVRDTAAMVAGMPESISGCIKGKEWNTQLFNHVPVYVALTVLEKFKKDVYTGELLALNRMLLEAKAHPAPKPVARP